MYLMHLVILVGLLSCVVTARETPAQIRAKMHELTVAGRMNDIIEYLEGVERDYGTLLVDDQLPSLFSYKGVALYNGLRVQEAEDTLKQAVKHFPKDTRSWINIGEMQVQTFKLIDAYHAFNQALQGGDMSALPRALRAKGWSASWEHFESLAYALERETTTCVNTLEECRVDSPGGLEYCDIDGRAHVVMNSLNPNAQLSPTQVAATSKAPYWRPKLAPSTAAMASTASAGKTAVETKPTKSFFEFALPKALKDTKKNEVVVAAPQKARTGPDTRRLKVGFMSADFGVHPVAQLVRGLFQFMNTSRVEVFCFSLQPQMSWWGQNISETVEHFVWLQGMNTFDAAKEVARLGIEILIDLNGHTMHSGLTIMSHQPAPLQMSYLGLPSTTAARFIDYYIADSIAVPPEQQHHFSEQLVLMSDCYIANDYAQIQGDVLKFNGPHRAPRSALNSPVDLTQASFLFGTLSNSQKMDPAIFQVWTNILRRFPGSQMAIVEHAGSSVYMPNLNRNGLTFGIEQHRLVGLKQTPWIDHVYVKTSFDLMLDTVTKNGHTTGLDGVWAGVPTLSMAGGQEAPARAAESIAVSLESTLGLAYSLKEYEDMAFALAMKSQRGKRDRRSPPEPNKDAPTESSAGNERDSKQASGEDAGERRLRLWRKHVGELRTQSNLFDMPLYEDQFTRLLQGTWELAHIARYKTAFQPNAAAGGIITSMSKKRNYNGAFNAKKLFHLFSPVSNRYHNRDQFAVEPESPTASSRLHNRNAQGRLQVHQTFSEGSMISAAAALLDGGMSPRTALDDNPGSAGHSRAEATAAGASATTSSSSTAAAAAAETETGYHQTRKGATGGTAAHGGASRKFPDIPRYVFDGRLIMLNIGGLKPEEGWLTVNSQAFGNTMRAHEVDIVREMHDLHGLDNNSVSAIYSSHTLEHNSFGDHALENTLAEWYRVLRPGGILLVSVPNLETLARMLLDPSFSLEDQWLVTRMIYGAQSDAFDYHMVGFTYNILRAFLTQAGFCEVERVDSFNMFQDTSMLTHNGYFISLNVAAKVCAEPDLPGRRNLKPDDGFSVDHQATPYSGV